MDKFDDYRSASPYDNIIESSFSWKAVVTCYPHEVAKSLEVLDDWGATEHEINSGNFEDVEIIAVGSMDYEVSVGGDRDNAVSATIEDIRHGLAQHMEVISIEEC